MFEYTLMYIGYECICYECVGYVEYNEYSFMYFITGFEFLYIYIYFLRRNENENNLYV